MSTKMEREVEREIIEEITRLDDRLSERLKSRFPTLREKPYGKRCSNDILFGIRNHKFKSVENGGLHGRDDVSVCVKCGEVHQTRGFYPTPTGTTAGTDKTLGYIDPNAETLITA